MKNDKVNYVICHIAKYLKKTPNKPKVKLVHHDSEGVRYSCLFLAQSLVQIHTKLGLDELYTELGVGDVLSLIGNPRHFTLAGFDILFRLLKVIKGYSGIFLKKRVEYSLDVKCDSGQSMKNWDQSL